jgi:hypothetical protein
MHILDNTVYTNSSMGREWRNHAGFLLMRIGKKKLIAQGLLAGETKGEWPCQFLQYLTLPKHALLRRFMLDAFGRRYGNSASGCLYRRPSPV